VGADADTALIEEVAVTPANVNDGRAEPEALPDAPGEVFADSAYRGAHFREAGCAKGGTPRIAVTSMWELDEQETLARLAAFNAPIHRVRARIEKIFGTWKRSYGACDGSASSKLRSRFTSPPSPITSSALSASPPSPSDYKPA
jgi:IS5 family transposase